jgi:hypothetical protein
MLDDHASLGHPPPDPLSQIQSVRGSLIRAHLREPVLDGPRYVDLLALPPQIRLASRQPGQRRFGVGG